MMTKFVTVEVVLLTFATLLAVSEIGREIDGMSLIEVVSGLTIVLAMVIAAGAVVFAALAGVYEGYRAVRSAVA